MPEKVAEINVKKLSIFRQHDIIGMPVADAEDKGGHTVARARMGEIVQGLFVRRGGLVHLLQPFQQTRIVRLHGADQTAHFLLNFHDRPSVTDHFDDAEIFSRR